MSSPGQSSHRDWYWFCRSTSLLCMTAVFLALSVMQALAGNDVSVLRPGIGPYDHRQAVAVDRVPWRGLGRVQTVLGERCTGFAAAPRVLITAAHCLWLPKTGRYIQPNDVHVLMGYERGTYRVHAVVTQFVIPPEYDPRDEGRTARFDRATLVLDQPVVEAKDLVPVGVARVGAAAMLVGYPQDRAEIAYGDLSCRILTGAPDGLIRHDCSATRGDSGGPLLAVQADGSLGFVGVDVLAEGRIAGGFAVPAPR